ncbi:hypothetical protein C5S29_16135, partial [ANME-1 cluster archaeon GoMg3.2]|nr:hypothetical protein [ANME-1 cluster archaeon GoMg3.2]
FPINLNLYILYIGMCGMWAEISINLYEEINAYIISNTIKI